MFRQYTNLDEGRRGGREIGVRANRVTRGCINYVLYFVIIVRLSMSALSSGSPGRFDKNPPASLICTLKGRYYFLLL